MSENKKHNSKSDGNIGFGGGMHVEKAKDFSGTMKKLIKYMNKYIAAIIIVFIFAIFSTIFSIVGPKILGRATDKIFEYTIKSTVYNTIHENMPKELLELLPAGTTIETLNESIVKIPPAKLQKLSPDTLKKLQGSQNGAEANYTDKIPEAYLDSIMSTEVNTKPVMDFSAIQDIMMLLIALYLISALFSYVQGFIMAGISQKVSYNLRRDISEKFTRLPIKYFDSKSHGDTLSRVTNDVDTVSQTLNQSLSQIVSSITMIFGILVMMLSINLLLTGVALITLPLSFILIILIVKKSQKYFIDQQQSLSDVNGHVEEMYSGHTVMKAFNGEEKSIKKFNEHNSNLYVAGWKSQFFSGMMMPVMNFFGNAGFVAICVLGGYLVINGKVKIGGVQAFLQYIRQFNHPIAQSAQVMSILQSTAAAAERVFEFLEENEEISESDNPITPTKINGEVEFKNVNFGYNPEKIIINDFSAKIKPGQKVAIVGPTGAGKTTIVKLLMRFYEINSGSILIDGINIIDMRRSDLRQTFGMVLQDTWLFNGSITDNIRYGKPDATDDEVILAAKAAHVDHFVHTLPNGYDMILNEEASNVSQGQKQLLTIARAILVNPSILILDEATSSVDTRTEVLIQKAMANLTKNRTSFIIAHRLSTIRDADIILVMKDGDIVEQGHHEELLKANGFYYDLYNSQFEGDK